MVRLLLSVSILLFVFGCGTSGQRAADVPNYRIQTQQTASEEPLQAKEDTKATIARLEALALSIPQVKGVRCVMVGKLAVVGIDVDPALERSRVGTVKYSVAEALRKDPMGVNALVTADIDLTQRYREMKADVVHGRPFKGFAEELGDIVGRIMPQMPRDTAPKGGAATTTNQP